MFIQAAHVSILAKVNVRQSDLTWAWSGTSLIGCGLPRIKPRRAVCKTMILVSSLGCRHCDCL